MLSITPSTRKDLKNKPSIEKSPVVVSKIKKVEAAISRSVINIALPMSILVYFFITSATISVPPDEALQLKSIAAPMLVVSIA